MGMGAEVLRWIRCQGTKGVYLLCNTIKKEICEGLSGFSKGSRFVGEGASLGWKDQGWSRGSNGGSRGPNYLLSLKLNTLGREGRREAYRKKRKIYYVKAQTEHARQGGEKLKVLAEGNLSRGRKALASFLQVRPAPSKESSLRSIRVRNT